MFDFNFEASMKQSYLSRRFLGMISLSKREAVVSNDSIEELSGIDHGSGSDGRA